MRTARRGSRVAGRAKAAGRRGAGDGGVGRLLPGAAGAGHAADDDVGAAVGEPGGDELEERRLEGVGRERRRRRRVPTASASAAPSGLIAQARRFDEPQSTAIQSAVVMRRPRSDAGAGKAGSGAGSRVRRMDGLGALRGHGRVAKSGGGAGMV